jgi:citrate lyase subunit beta/citryl-CoA lyase
MNRFRHDWLTGPALLFCPGDRPDRFDKAYAAADMVILDLEDGVAPGQKDVARTAIRESSLDPARTIVRVNSARHPDFREDRLAVEAAGYEMVMLAMAESASDMEGLDGLAIIALCETPQGILGAETIAAHPGVVGLMWGAEDLTASLGGASSRNRSRRYTDVVRYSRSRVLLAAAAAGKRAIDGVYLTIDDAPGLAEETEDAVRSGFAAKSCIHPGQVQVVRQCFAPTSEELLWARSVTEAGAGQHGVFALGNEMVDEPLLKQARRLLERANSVMERGQGDPVDEAEIQCRSRDLPQ